MRGYKAEGWDSGAPGFYSRLCSCSLCPQASQYLPTLPIPCKLHPGGQLTRAPDCWRRRNCDAAASSALAGALRNLVVLLLGGVRAAWVGFCAGGGLLPASIAPILSTGALGLLLLVLFPHLVARLARPQLFFLAPAFLLLPSDV